MADVDNWWYVMCIFYIGVILTYMYMNMYTYACTFSRYSLKAEIVPSLVTPAEMYLYENSFYDGQDLWKFAAHP